MSRQIGCAMLVAILALASPALVDGTWYIRTTSELIAIAN